MADTNEEPGPPPAFQYDPEARVPYRYTVFPSSREVQDALYKRRLVYQPQPHTNPNSVLVAAMGTLWSKGSYMRVKRMCDYHGDYGFPVYFDEIPDANVNLPYQDSGHMNDLAIIRAMNMHVEWLCILDCDVLPEPDLLTKLMLYEVPVIAPAIIDPLVDATLSIPRLPLNTGLHQVKWFCHTFMLFQTSLSHAFPGLKVMVGDVLEGAIFDRLWHHGHQPMMQTNLECKVASRPHGMRDFTYKEYNDLMRRTWARRLDPIDRTSEV